MSRWKIGRKTVLGSLGALALAVGAAAYAAGTQDDNRPGRAHGRHEWRGPLGGGMLRGLDLTEEQRASFKQALEEHRKAQEPLRQQHRELREQIRQQLEGGNADPTAIGQLTIQAHGLGKQLRESHAGLRERLESLLTPEQKARLEERKAEQEKRKAEQEKRGLGRSGRPGRFGPRPETKAQKPGSEL